MSYNLVFTLLDKLISIVFSAYCELCVLLPSSFWCESHSLFLAQSPSCSLIMSRNPLPYFFDPKRRQIVLIGEQQKGFKLHFLSKYPSTQLKTLSYFLITNFYVKELEVRGFKYILMIQTRSRLWVKKDHLKDQKEVGIYTLLLQKNMYIGLYLMAIQVVEFSNGGKPNQKGFEYCPDRETTQPGDFYSQNIVQMIFVWSKWVLLRLACEFKQRRENSA